MLTYNSVADGARVLREVERIEFGNVIFRYAKDGPNVLIASVVKRMACRPNIVVENGTILEEGTQKELLAMQSRYAELFNMQARKYRAEK